VLKDKAANPLGKIIFQYSPNAKKLRRKKIEKPKK